MVRRDVRGTGADLHTLAERRGYVLVFTVAVDASALVAALVVAQHVYEHNAKAVVVPSFEHADPLRHVVTDLAALITPMRTYPHGYRWPLAEPEDERR